MSAAGGSRPAGRRRRSRLRLRRNRCGPRYGSGKAVRQWRGRRGRGESIAAGPERPLARVLRPIRSMAKHAREAIAALSTLLVRRRYEFGEAGWRVGETDVSRVRVRVLPYLY